MLTAEENINSSVISDSEFSIIGHDQGVSFSSGDCVSYRRRNSTGETSSVDRKQKNVPHYLRASTGSCHDFCKYGRKQNFEEKRGLPLWKKTTRAPSSNQIVVVAAAQGESKKKVAFKRKTSADKRPVAVQSPGPPEIIKREVLSSSTSEVSQKKELSSAESKLISAKRVEIGSSKKMNVLPEKLSPSKLQVAKQSKKKTDSIPEKPTLSLQPQITKQSSSSSSFSYQHRSEKVMKLLTLKKSPSQRQAATAKSSPSPQLHGDTDRRGRRNDYIKSSRDVALSKSSVKKTVVTPTSSIPRRSSLSSGTTSLQAQKSGGSKLIPHISLNRMQKAAGKETDTEKAREKILRVVKTEACNSRSELIEYSDIIQSLPTQSYSLPDSLSHPCSSSLTCEDVGQEEKGKDEEEEDVGQEEKEEEEEVGQEEEEEEEEEEVEVDEEEEEEELEEEVDEVDGEEHEYSSDRSEALISCPDTTDGKGAEGNHQKPLRKGTIPSASKDSMAVKLRFRRGRVVDIQSESNGPRRLRFRRARVMEDNQDNKNETRRKIFKKKGDITDGSVMNPQDKKVVLRHQDAKEKKDAQGLLNNVIEETASKLVESRKSKVKALVGAFETVISLQESKPSALPVV